jgi:hypothetical protein
MTESFQVGGGYGLAQVSLVVLIILLELGEVNTLVLGMQTFA